MATRNLKRLLQSHSGPMPLWLWMGLRMSALAIGAVIAVAAGMWAYFHLQDRVILGRVPPAAREEILRLREHPKGNEDRLWSLVQQHYSIEQFIPGLANPDWLMVGALVACEVPFLVLFGVLASRNLSRQFGQVASSARRVAGGDFRVRAKVQGTPPREMVELTEDFNDMTAKLAQYDRELSESGAMLAHELRTPLNAAMGRVQGMLDDVFPCDATQLALVHRQLKQINRLVGDLRLLSLARAGQLHLEHEVFSLSDLVRERLAWLELAMDETDVRPTVILEGELTVHGDRDRVGQVVLVLMENVLRHAAEGGVLEVRAVTGDAAVELTVADRGPGVAEDDLPLLLDRFWRADRSRSRDSGGSGLGLAIAEAICRAHGGSLTVSRREGGGLRATVTLLRKTEASRRSSE